MKKYNSTNCGIAGRTRYECTSVHSSFTGTSCGDEFTVFIPQDKCSILRTAELFETLTKNDGEDNVYFVFLFCSFFVLFFQKTTYTLTKNKKDAKGHLPKMIHCM